MRDTHGTIDTLSFYNFCFVLYRLVTLIGMALDIEIDAFRYLSYYQCFDYYYYYCCLFMP